MVLILLLPTYVYGVGISGNDLDIETVFIPNTRFNFEFFGITNKLHDGLDYTISLKGDISQYVEMDQWEFENKGKKEHIPMIGHINFPENLEPPRHTLRVCFMESCPGDAAMCGRTAACAVVIVDVPYEGIHPDLSLKTTDVNENEPVNIKATITNNGKDTINSCSGYVDVFDAENKSINTVTLTNTGSINSFKSAGLTGEFMTLGVPAGNYSAIAHVDCDGISNTAISIFKIGSLNVNIIKYPKEISTGGIKKFSTTIESAWNSNLEVYADVTIFDTDKKATATTATHRLDPWKTANLDAFIDTSNLEEKEYDLKIEAFYSGTSKIINDKITLVEPSADEPEEPIQEKPEKDGISTTTLTIMLVLIVLILTVVNIFLAVYRKKKE